MPRTHRKKPDTLLDDMRAEPVALSVVVPQERQDAEIAANVAFWKVFMPRYYVGAMPRAIDACTAEACCNIIDTVLDMLGDVVARDTKAQPTLTLVCDPPITAQTMLNKVRAQLAAPTTGLPKPAS